MKVDLCEALTLRVMAAVGVRIKTTLTAIQVLCISDRHKIIDG